MNRRPELKLQLQNSLKHVYNQETRSLDVIMSLRGNMKGQWEVTQVVEGLQRLENFKSQFLANQFAETSDFLWKLFERFGQSIQAAKSTGPETLIDVESQLEAAYIRQHLASPGDEIWLPDTLRSQLRTQRSEHNSLCKRSLHDYLTKAQ